MSAVPRSLTAEHVVAARRELARRRLIDFTRYTKPDFMVARHHKQIAEALESVERGECDRLMIFAPPRHTKSELASRRFPAWYLGRHPDKQIISATYSGDFALDFGREVRGIIQSEEYGEVFPGVSIAQDSRAANRWHTEQGGVSVYVGVGGPITGRGAHIALIDDPFKNREEADSEVRRETVWKWYTSTLRTRLMPGGAIIIIMTRWHEDDLAGRLLEQQPDGWKVVELQAIDSEGSDDESALWPEWYDLTALKRIKAEVTARDWHALFQQRPVPDDGSFFRREWFLRFVPEQLPKNLHKYITTDHAPAGNTDSDYNCVRVWGVDPDGDVWLIDGRRWQAKMEAVVEYALQMVAKHKPFAWFPEDDNNWKAVSGFVTREMRKKIDGKMRWVRIEPISPHGADKPTKAQPFQALAEQGSVHIPLGPDGDDVLEQYIKFPAGKHDDEVDAASLIGRAISDAHPAMAASADAARPKEDSWAKAFGDDEDAESDWKTQ